MTKTQSWLLVGCGILLSIVLCGGFICAVSHLDAALDTWNDAGRTATGTVAATADAIAVTLGGLNNTLEEINAPCAGFHGSVTCGPLAQLSQTEKNIGILAGKSAEQVQQSATLINTAAAGLKDVSDSAKGALDEGKRTLEQVNDNTHGIGATMAKVNTDIDGFNDYVKSEQMQRVRNDFADTIHNVQFGTQNLTGVTLDLRMVADKQTQDFLKPVKWYMYPIKRAGQMIDIGAAVARHLP